MYLFWHCFVVRLLLDKKEIKGEEKILTENRFGGCRTFNVRISIGIISVGSDLTVCCNFLGQCHTNKQTQTGNTDPITGYKADISKLLQTTKSTNADSITILESEVINVDGDYFRLEKGIYKIIDDGNGNKYIDVVILPATITQK